MKYTLFVMLIAYCLKPTASNAQSKQNHLGINFGYSVFNSKSVNLFYDWGLKNKNYWGLHACLHGYNETKSPLNLKSSIRFGFAGLHYNLLLKDSRNFSHYVMVSGAVGTYKKRIQWLPALGLQQVFYTGANTQLFTGEELNYLLGNPKELFSNKWQPVLKTGIRFSLD